MTEPNWSSETDADLLFYMAMREDEPEMARAAWEEFYNRHVEYLFSVCMKFGRILGGEQGVADLVQDTLRRAYERADTFTADGLKEPDELRLWTRAWLGTIATNLLRSALRSHRNINAEFLDQEHWQDIPERTTDPPDAEKSEPEDVRQMREAFSSLPERQQTVVLLRMQWYDPTKKHQRLPNAVAADLAAKLGTTPENFRKIYERSMRQLKEKLPTATPVSQKGR
jgi:RNA polymerase sigma factor (sigma-70 family)